MFQINNRRGIMVLALLPGLLASKLGCSDTEPQRSAAASLEGPAQERSDGSAPHAPSMDQDASIAAAAPTSTGSKPAPLPATPADGGGVADAGAVAEDGGLPTDGGADADTPARNDAGSEEDPSQTGDASPGTGGQPDAAAPPSGPSFSDIASIFLEHCGACHAGNYAHADQALAELYVRNERQNILYRIQLPPNDSSFMPQGGEPVSDEEIALIKAWANAQ